MLGVYHHSEENTVNKSKWLIAGLAAAGLAGGVFTLGATIAAPAADQPRAQAQFNPEPQDCACSRGVDVGNPKASVLLKNCVCGALQCAVLPASGQLQCSR